MPKRLLLLSAVVFTLVSCGVGTRCFANTIGKADGLRAEKEYVQAEAIYKQIISESNDIKQVLQAQKRLTIMYIESNNEPRAKQAFQELVAKFAGHEGVEEVVFELGEEYSEEKKYDRAREVYQYLVDHWPQTGEAIEAQEAAIQISIRLKDEAAAQQGYDDLITKFTGNERLAKAVDHVADAYRHSDRYEKARELYRYIVQSWPEAEHAMESQRGVVLSSIRMGDDANAASELEKLISDFAENENIARAVCEVADEYRESGRYDEALANYNYVVQTWPETEHAMEVQSGVVLTNISLKDDSAADAALNVLISKYSKSEDIEEIVKDIAGEYCELDRHQDAIEVYEKVVENWPESDEAIESQAEIVKLYVSASDDANAQAAIDKLATQFSKEGEAVEAIEEVAEEYSEAREYGNAIELYKRMVETWPDNDSAIGAQTNMARLYIRIGDDPNAQASFNVLTGKFSGDERIAEAVWEVGEAYWDDGSVKKAYEKYKYVVEHRPKSEQAIWAKMGMVRSLVRQSDLERAEAEFGELLTNFGGHKDVGAVVHEIVEEYRNTGAYEEGRGLFAYLLENWDESDSTMLELQVGVALQSIKLGELDKADAAVTKLIADYNDHANLAKALFQIAEEHFYARNYDKAIELWKLVETSYQESEFPNKKEIAYMLATCYDRLEDYEKAIAYYTKAMEERPNCQYAYRIPYELGLACRRQGRHEEAASWFKRQRELSDSKLYGDRALFCEGLVYLFRLRDYGKAAEAFQEYSNSYPEGESIEIIPYDLALCYEKMGEEEKAIKQLQEGLEKYPDTEYAKDYKEKLAQLQKED